MSNCGMEWTSGGVSVEIHSTRRAIAIKEEKQKFCKTLLVLKGRYDCGVARFPPGGFIFNKSSLDYPLLVPLPLFRVCRRQTGGKWTSWVPFMLVFLNMNGTCCLTSMNGTWRCPGGKGRGLLEPRTSGSVVYNTKRVDPACLGTPSL